PSPPPSPLSLLYTSPPHPDLHSFPTRRSSDLPFSFTKYALVLMARCAAMPLRSDGSASPTSTAFESASRCRRRATSSRMALAVLDRKSTRLNSSHVAISYAVFCLKKKNIEELK